MSDQVSVLYADVIKNVMKEMQPQFQAEGDEHALNELIQLWIAKVLGARVLPQDAPELNQLMQTVTATHPTQSLPLSGFIPPNMNLPPQTLAHLGVPPPLQQQQQQQQQQHNRVHQMAPQPLHSYVHGQSNNPSYHETYQHFNRPPSAASLSTVVDTTNLRQDPIGRPRPNIHQPQQRPGMPHPQFLPQNDGGNDEESSSSTQAADEQVKQQLAAEEEGVVFEIEIPKKLQKKMRADKRLPQFDGVGDDEEEEGEEGDEEEEGEGGNEESLNSSLDSSDGEQEPENRNNVVCLYDKVTRTKAKWRCVLKEGIMNLKDKDYVFQKATGEFDW